MSDINWAGLNRGPNIFGELAQGLAYGTELRRDNIKAEREDARQKAYNLFATDPVAAERALMAAGDVEGATTLRTRARQDRTDGARTKATELYGKGDTKGAQTELMNAGEFDEAKAIAGLDNEQRKAAAERAGVMAAYLESLDTKTPEEAKAQITADVDALTELGYTREQILSFDPSPANRARLKAQALGLKGVLEQKDREADNTRADATLTETKRANQSREGISRGQLGVAQSNSARGWASFNERKKAGGFGTPGVGGGVVADDDVEIDP